LVDETYVRIRGVWHYLSRAVDTKGALIDAWLSPRRDLATAVACFRRAIRSIPEHVVTDKARFYPAAIREHVPNARHTATGFYNQAISTKRCERSHGRTELPPRAAGRGDRALAWSAAVAAGPGKG
jgi:transposase-like protein